MICADPGADIPNDPLHYIPTTAPGARMPSMLMAGGVPIFDRLGLWFTLACFGAAPSEALVAAAARRGVPLDVLRIDDADDRRGSMAADCCWSGRISISPGAARPARTRARPMPSSSRVLGWGGSV